MKAVPSIAIVVKEESKEAQKYLSNLTDLIYSDREVNIGAPTLTNLIVVLGGDGTMLKAIREYGYLDKPFLGINFGDVGFFMEEAVSENELLRRIKKKIMVFYEVEYRKMAVEFYCVDNEHKMVEMFNDCTLQNSSGQALHLKIFLDGEEVNTFSGDGLLVATAQGTTGYAISAGGPAIHHGVDAYTVVPQNPQIAWRYRSLLFPIVLPYSITLRVEVSNPTKRKADVSIDGVRYQNIKSMHVFYHGKNIKLWKFKPRGEDYVIKLVNKIIGRPISA